MTIAQLGVINKSEVPNSTSSFNKTYSTLNSTFVAPDISELCVVPAIGTCQRDDTAGTSELGIVHKVKKTTSVLRNL